MCTVHHSDAKGKLLANCISAAYNSNLIHNSQSLFLSDTALHVSGVTITHCQEHKTAVTTTSGDHYTVIDRVR